MNMNCTKRLTLLLLAPSFAAGSAMAQQTAQTVPPPYIVVTADAIVTAKPDQAQIDIGVVTQSATAEAATAENAQRVDATIKSIRKVLGSGNEIKTIGYSVNPVYRYPKEGGTPSITGYSVSNVVQVTTNDLAAVGHLIDAATASGANTIRQLRFSLKDDQAVRLRALAEAASKAKARAQAMAAALGLQIVRTLRAEEQGGGMQSPSERLFAMPAAAGAQAAATTVEAGTVEARAVVTLTVEVRQQ
jgi:hypothetical protein